MKLNVPVILLVLNLIAYSVPGAMIAPINIVSSHTGYEISSKENKYPIILSKKIATTPTLPTGFPVINVINAEKLVGIHSIPVKNIYQLIWEPDSQSVTAIQPATITRYNSVNLNALETYTLPENSAFLDYEANSRQVLLTSDRRHLIIHPMDGKKDVSILAPANFVTAVFERGGTRIWVSLEEEHTAAVIDVKTGKELTSCGGFETAAPVYTALPSPAGRWLVWIARATIQLDTRADCTRVTRIGHQDFIMSHAFSTDDNLLAVSAGGELDGAFQPLLYIYNAETGKQEAVIPLEGSPAVDLSFSPDARIIASAGSGLSLLDVKTGQELKRIASSKTRFLAAEFSPDGRTLAAADETSLFIYAVTH